MDDEIKSLPFASDQAALNFAYFFTAITAGHVIDMHLLRRRNHIRLFRYSAWAIPLAVAGVYIATPALPMKFKDFFWGFGLRGRAIPPYHDEDED
eukprot:732770_1